MTDLRENCPVDECFGSRLRDRLGTREPEQAAKKHKSNVKVLRVDREKRNQVEIDSCLTGAAR